MPLGSIQARPGGRHGKTKKNLLLQNKKVQSFHILYVAMYSGPLYKSCQPCPVVKMAPPRWSLAHIDLQWKKKTLKHLLRNHKAQSFPILCGPPYKSCQPCPGVKNGPAQMVISSHRLTMGKNIKKSSPKPQGTELSYFVCSNV